MQTFLGVEEGGRSGSMLFLNLISNLGEEEGRISKDRNSKLPEYHRKKSKQEEDVKQSEKGLDLVTFEKREIE